MLTELRAREQCLRITPSKLVSWILGQYKTEHFERDQDRIVQAHFNSKEYLKQMIRGASSAEDLTQALQAALGRIGKSDSKKQSWRKSSRTASVNAEPGDAETKSHPSSNPT